MKKIEFIAMSLPSGLKVRFDDNIPIEINVNGVLKDNALLEFRDESKISLPISDCKPILHPLPDLTKEIEHKGEKFVPKNRLEEMATCKNANKSRLQNGIESLVHGFKENTKRVIEEDIPVFMFQKLIEWHFDIANLIEQGEAIDANTLELNPYK